MENLLFKIKGMKDETSFIKKRDTLMNIIVNSINSLNDRCAFIKEFRTPLETKSIDAAGLENLMNNIFGYYVYLNKFEHNNYNTKFLNDSLHDLRNFLLNGGEKIKTKGYKIYL